MAVWYRCLRHLVGPTMGLRPLALPGQHAAGQVFYVGEAGGLEDHTGLAAAVAATAVANYFLIPEVIDILGLHIPDAAEREQGAADIEFGMFGRFADVQ